MKTNGFTIGEARGMHDSDLAAAALVSEVARSVDASRTAAAAQLRVVVARVYGRGDMMGASQWHVLPCLTDAGTIGILNVADGTAWDTGVAAHPGVEDLGLFSEKSYAAAYAPKGDVRFDGELVQRDGAAVKDGVTLTPTMPTGWRQIALPTWRGYGGRSPYQDVPETEFPPEQWIRPRLVAQGLRTCYGRLGKVMEHPMLAKTHTWDRLWPQGVPPWIEGTSVTIVDAMVGGLDCVGDQTGLPRASQEEEMARVERAIGAAEKLLRRRLALASRNYRRAADVRSREKTKRERAEAKELDDVARQLEHLASKEDLDLVSIAKVASRGGNATNWGYDERAMSGVDSLRRARRDLASGRPWSAARALRLAGFDAETLIVAALELEPLVEWLDGFRRVLSFTTAGRLAQWRLAERA
jgi:hypothetical protein